MRISNGNAMRSEGGDSAPRPSGKNGPSSNQAGTSGGPGGRLRPFRNLVASHGSLLLALAAALLLEASIVARSAVIAKDGVGFLRIADNLSVDFQETLQREDQHPGYPLLTLAAGRALALISTSDPFSTSIAGAHLASALSGLVVVVLVWLLTKSVYDRRVANIAAMLCAVWPLLRLNAADTLSDSSHVMFYLAGAWMVCQGLTSRRAAWFAGAGAMSGLAYWVRPEGLSVSLVAGLFLVAVLVWRRLQMPVARMALGLVLLATTTAAVVSPYMYVSGKLTSKKKVFSSAPQADVAPGLPPDFSQPTAGLLSEPAPGQPLPDDRPRPPSRAGAIVAGIAELGHELGEGFLYFLLVPLALGNLPLGKVTRTRTSRASLPASFLFLLCLCHAILLVTLYVMAGYVSHRHVIPMVALMIPSTAAGLLVGADLLTQRAPVAWRAAVGAPALTAMVCLLLMPKYFKPLHHIYSPILAASQWLERHSRPEDAVLTTSNYVRFYAHRHGTLVGPEVGNLSAGLAQAPEQQGWPFVVLEIDQRVFDRRALADAGYLQVHEFPGHERKEWSKIVVFQAQGSVAGHMAKRLRPSPKSTQ